MDTRFLETFISIVENGSIAEAARRLNLSPAAVAQRIQALEVEIGTQLLMRVGKQVRATQAGLSVINRARNVTREVRDLRAIAAGNLAGGELFLGATSTAMNGVVPDALKLLSERHDSIHVHLVIGRFGELYQSVMDGRLDAAIGPEPVGTMPKTLDWHPLWVEPLVLMAAVGVPVGDPDHALATRTFIRYDRSSAGGRLAERYLRQRGIRPHQRFELYALHAVAAMVERGIGISLAPDWAPAWPKALPIQRIPVGDNSFDRHIGVVWSRVSSRVRLVSVFMQAAQDALDLQR